MLDRSPGLTPGACCMLSDEVGIMWWCDVGDGRVTISAQIVDSDIQHPRSAPPG